MITRRRVVVVGAPGSGKTTTATEIARRLGLPRVELDALHWGPGWTPVENSTLRDRLGAAVAGDAWVVDGNYFSLGSADIVWPRADTIVFLDLPRSTVMRRVLIRSLRRAALGTELWAGNRESLRTLFFARDSLLWFTWNEYPKYPRRYRELERDPAWSHLQWVRLTTGRAASEWLRTLSESHPRHVHPAPEAAPNHSCGDNVQHVRLPHPPTGARQPVLIQLRAPGQPTAVVLVLHGGREVGYGSVPAHRLTYVRMRPFAHAVQARSRDVAVALLRYRYRGWNGPDADPVRDTEWAIEQLVRTHGAVPMVLVGHSMGGRAALRAAGDPRVSAVAGLAPWLPAGEPTHQLVGRDVLLVHGTADVTTRPKSTAAFARAITPIARRVACVEVRRSGHAMLQRAALWHDLTAAFVDNVTHGSPLPEPLLEAFAAGARGEAFRV